MTLSPGKIAQPEAGGSPLGSGVPAPAFAACRPPLLTSAKAPVRLAVLFHPNGVYPPAWNTGFRQ